MSNCEAPAKPQARHHPSLSALRKQRFASSFKSSLLTQLASKALRRSQSSALTDRQAYIACPRTGLFAICQMMTSKSGWKELDQIILSSQSQIFLYRAHCDKPQHRRSFNILPSKSPSWIRRNIEQERHASLPSENKSRPTPQET